MDVLGPEPEDEAQTRTNLHVVRRLHATTDQKTPLWKEMVRLGRTVAAGRQ
jgi:hypothetical protein